MAAINPAVSQSDPRLGASVVTLSPAEAQVIAEAQDERADNMGMRQTAKEHAAAGYLTRQDILVLNYPLMTDPDPRAPALLDRLRTAITKEQIR